MKENDEKGKMDGRRERKSFKVEDYSYRRMCQYWNSIHRMADGAKQRKKPWLMMFDVDLQITFFKLLTAKED